MDWLNSVEEDTTDLDPSVSGGLLPRNGWEVHRLTYEHHLFHHILHGHYLAPVRYPSRILDVGCRTGQWAIEMAQKFPQAKVVGLDAVPPLSSASLRPMTYPPNYHFVQANLLEQLPFAGGAFDYIHMRLVATMIPHSHWSDLLNELVRVCRPGGWIELTEMGLPPDGTALLMFWIAQLAQRSGYHIFPGKQIADRLQQAGMHQIQLQEVMLTRPYSHGGTGRNLMSDLLALAETLRPAMVARGVVSPRAFSNQMALMKQQLLHSKPVDTLPIYVAFGRCL